MVVDGQEFGEHVVLKKGRAVQTRVAATSVPREGGAGGGLACSKKLFRVVGYGDNLKFIKSDLLQSKAVAGETA